MTWIRKVLGLVRIVKSQRQATVNPWLSVALSLFLPGLGHFQLGATRIGMTLIAAWSLVRVLGMYQFWETATSLSRIDILGWFAVAAIISLAACVGSYRRAKESESMQDGRGLPVRSLSLALISPLLGYWSAGHGFIAGAYLIVILLWHSWVLEIPGLVGGMAGTILYHVPHLAGLVHLGWLMSRRRRGRVPVLSIRRVVLGLGILGLLADVAYWSHWKMESLGSFRIKGDAMAPVVREGDWVITRAQAEYARSDAVIFDSPDDKQYVRRIVAIPGDRMFWERGRLSIDGTVIRTGIRGPKAPGAGEVETLGPVFVLPNTFWVAGDNPECLTAGLTLIRKEEIRGRAWRMIWPAGRAKLF